MSKTKWTGADSAAASKQGWDLFQSEGGKVEELQLQCDDEAGIFKTDDEAAAFVKTQAEAGDELAIKAIQRLIDVGSSDVGRFSLASFTQVPIKMDLVFGDVPGDNGESWELLGRAENALAEKLKDLPEGTAAILDENAWFLAIIGGKRVLCHANHKDGILSEVSNRFEAGLDWGDIENDDLVNSANLVTTAADGFKTTTITIPALDDIIDEPAPRAI